MCRICRYNQVQTIDRALLAGATPESLLKKYRSFSLPELQHHQAHLLHKMALTQNRFHDHLRQGLFLKLHLVMEMVLAVLRSAKGGGDAKLFLQATREFTRLLTLMHKMAANMHLDPEFIYCLMASPPWDLQEDTLLPAASQALAQTRRTLKQQFFFNPCPEPDPEPACHGPGQAHHPDLDKPASDLPPQVAALPTRPPQSGCGHKSVSAIQAGRQRDKTDTEPERNRDRSGTAAGQKRDESPPL